ncbi:hypothetical protein Lac2_25570 [Claveliimonas bilis]|uniref:sugar transferase n=1 Tax=Claveliimonas bilis TaxID=3028070 RepID=UPI0029306A66|nr:sugar transferase [Claveliimonas bilis]BDZ84423.1 hypothetical protein Lac2_25570 [Claveliimonas bilis]
MSNDRNIIKKFIEISGVVLGAAFVGMSILAKKKKRSAIYEDDKEKKNPFEGKKVILIEDENDKENADGIKGHLEATGNADYNPGFYEKRIKRAIDVILSFGGLVVLSPVFAAIALAIKIEDPGPVLFTQKRVGRNKKYFKLHKFRSMKMSTPHDVPTHQLENPEQYITKVGKFLRAHSLDELPQIWDIFIGNMSVIGPRPGLWNQDLLTAERDKHNANDVKPGLTGWAQINGRDELEIPDKARLDGEYVKKMGLGMDIKCFLGSIHVIGKDESVVEGGTGEMKKKSVGRHYTDGKSDEELIGHIGFGEPVQVDRNVHKRVLITGDGSYIGEAFLAYVAEHYPDNFTIDTVDMIDSVWRDMVFSSYDIVYHVAGIAHADVGNVSDETKEKYYAVNTDLAIEVAKKAKDDGVKEFIFMSSMIIYGESAPYGMKKVVDEHTVPNPANFYGDSKLQADIGVRELADDQFKVTVLRPPMIYGKDSKGNYPTLAKLAKKLPIFPNVDNERSMLYIENLCEFLCQVMLVEKVKDNAIVLIPQNAEWTKTSEMVREIGEVTGKKVRLIGGIVKPAISLGGKVHGKIGGLVNKAFGNNCYVHKISIYPGINYQNTSLRESIRRTEGDEDSERDNKEYKKHILVISQYFYPEQFRINDICQEWVKRGYKVTVVTGIPNYPQGEFYDGYGYDRKRTDNWKGINIIRLPIKPRKTGAINLSMNYMSFVIQGYKWVRETHIKADKVFIYEVSPMTQALVGVWYAKKYGVKCNLYVTDLWPENVEIVLGIHNRIILGTIGVMVNYIYKRCDYIFTSSKSFIDKIANRGVRKNKILFWPQYAEEFYRKLHPSAILEIPNDGILNITFAGNLGTAQGLDVLVDTADILRNENIFVRFNIIGNGRYEDELKNHIKDANVEEYFNFIPRQAAEKIPEYFAWSDVALITLSKSEVYSMTIPAKTQSCLACGIPVLVSADGEVQEIIKEAKCGYCSDSGDPNGLATNIKKVLVLGETERKQLSENALTYYKNHFDKKKLMDEMEAYI